MFSDASRVAFIYYGGKFNDGPTDKDAHEVRVLDLSSGRVRTVAKDLYDAGDLAVSPDMTRYAVTMIVGDEYRLAVGDIAGESEPEPIEISGVQGSPRLPAWSPDGTRLAFSAPLEIQTADADLPPTFREQVALVSAAGGRAQVLFEGSPDHSVPTIVWSPHGTKLLVTTHYPRKTAAAEIDVATGVVQPLVQARTCANRSTPTEPARRSWLCCRPRKRKVPISRGGSAGPSRPCPDSPSTCGPRGA